MNWLKQALTGADNQTVAIGRLVGMAVAIALLIVLPLTAAATVIHGAVPVEAWQTLLSAGHLCAPRGGRHRRADLGDQQHRAKAQG